MTLYLALGRRPVMLRDRERAVLERERDDGLLRLRRVNDLALALRAPLEDRDLERLAFFAAPERRILPVIAIASHNRHELVVVKRNHTQNSCTCQPISVEEFPPPSPVGT